MKSAALLISVCFAFLTAGNAQTFKSLSYNTTNNTVSGPTNTNSLVFTNPTSFTGQIQAAGGTATAPSLRLSTNSGVGLYYSTALGVGPFVGISLASNNIGRFASNRVIIEQPIDFLSPTNTAAVGTRTNLGFSSVLNSLWTATNSADARSAIGLSASWLTNTNSTNFLADLGIGGTNTTSLGYTEISALYVAEDFQLNGDGPGLTFTAGSTPGEASAISSTRAALNLSLPALTNTNTATFRAAILPTYSNNTLKVLAVSSNGTDVEWTAVSNTVTDGASITNYPSYLLRTNGSASGLSNLFPALSGNSGKVLAVASGGTNLEWVGVSNTVTDASTLTNFPQLLLRTNGSAAGLTNFPTNLLTTTGSAAGLTNFPPSLLTTNNTNWPAFLLRTNGNAYYLTNFPPYLLNTNTTNFPSYLLRTNGNAISLTNFPSILLKRDDVVDFRSNVVVGAVQAFTAGTSVNLPGYYGRPNNAVALGIDTIVYGNDGNSTIGGLSNNNAPISIGYQAQSAEYGIAIGPSAYAYVSDIALGFSAKATNDGIANNIGRVAIGKSAFAGTSSQGEDGSRGGTVAVGGDSSASESGAVAIGGGAKALETSSAQIGKGTNLVSNTIQFRGAGSVTTNAWSALANSTAAMQDALRATILTNAPTNATNVSAWLTFTNVSAGVTNIYKMPLYK